MQIKLMNHYKKITFAVIAVSVLMAGCTFLNTTKEEMASVDKEMTEDAGANAGHYEEYSTQRFSELHGSEKFLLFFHADWCPTCRALEKNIKKDMSALNGHTVLETNYDTETELKKEYGVAVQTTVIFFDADGSVTKKKVNPRLSEIESFFN